MVWVRGWYSRRSLHTRHERYWVNNQCWPCSLLQPPQQRPRLYHHIRTLECLASHNSAPLMLITPARSHSCPGQGRWSLGVIRGRWMMKRRPNKGDAHQGLTLKSDLSLNPKGSLERAEWQCNLHVFLSMYIYVWMVVCVPYRSSLRYNSMVHDVSHGVQIEAFIYSRLNGREICQRALLAPPPRSTIISLRALRSASFETSQDGVNISSISQTLYYSQKSFVCFSLSTGWWVIWVP